MAAIASGPPHLPQSGASAAAFAAGSVSLVFCDGGGSRMRESDDNRDREHADARGDSDLEAHGACEHAPPPDVRWHDLSSPDESLGRATPISCEQMGSLMSPICALPPADVATD